MSKVKPQEIATRMYGLLSQSMSRIEDSLGVLEKESREGKEAKGGVNFLGQQLYQLSIAFSALRKEERDAAKTPLASDNLSQEEMKLMMAEIFTRQELEDMLLSKKEDKHDQEEIDGAGE
jgi:hypothetical protein